MILDLCHRSQELMSTLWEGDAEAFLEQVGPSFSFVSPITDPLDGAAAQVEVYCARARKVSPRLSCTILDAQCTHQSETSATILLVGTIAAAPDEPTGVRATFVWTRVQDADALVHLHVSMTPDTIRKIQAVEQAEIGMLAQLQKPAKAKSRQFVLRDTDGHTHVLRERDITFLESRHQYTVVHQHRDQYFVVRRPLTSVLEGMPDCFVRIHRSYAVNVTFVRQISRREVLLADGTSIPVPERRAKQVREDLLGVMSGLGAQGLMGSRA